MIRNDASEMEDGISTVEKVWALCKNWDEGLPQIGLVG
jgi:hypothetical protein